MTDLFKKLLLTLCALWVLASCGGGDGGIGGTGILRLSFTDAPSCGYDHVYLTVDRIRVNSSSTALDSDAGWSEVVLNPARRIDLLTLTNGVLDQLGQTSLPAGKYTQMRLVLVPNAGNGAAALANAVVPSGGSEVALATPSGTQSGIKFNVDMEVASGKVADFVVDFDVCKSIVRRGNSGQYNLKPVVAVIPLLSEAGMRVVGYVDASMALGTTNVSLQSSCVPVKATVPDSTGRFELFPVPAGTYDLVVTSAAHATAVITGVPVVTTAVTTINAASNPILTPDTSFGSVAGTLSPAGTVVRATQTLSGGTTIEVAWGLVDESITPAAFSFSLPVDAPMRAAYSANAVSLGLVADSPVEGKYTVEATAAGVLKTQAVDVNAAVAALVFAFP